MPLAGLGNNFASLRDKEKIQMMSALDLEIAVELELRRRRGQEEALQPAKIEPHHIAYASAFPLRNFIYETFPILEPGREYKNNWHIDAISELLQAATLGQIKNFLINLPRRGMKSSLICVMWPVWVWTYLPHFRWLFSSFSEKFALRDSENCRKLIRSAYYQQKFGEVFQLSRTVNTRRKFENTKGGFRSCFGVQKGTGDGGDGVIVDDPHEIDKAESDKVIETTINWWHGTMYNSVNDPATAIRGIVHQRVSERDLTGDILARELNYHHLCLPMSFEDDHPHRNSISKPFKMGKVSAFEKSQTPDLNIGEEKLWIDPRDKEAPTFQNKWYQNWYKAAYLPTGLGSQGNGEVLWPNRYTPEIIQEIITEIEAYGESAQLQQRPIRRGGNFFKSSDFGFFTLSEIQHDINGMTFCRYWDKAGSQDSGDWTVGMLAGRTSKRPYTIYILDIIRKQVGYYERMALMKDAAMRDTKDWVENRENTEYTVLIERELASSGKDLATIEKDHLQGYDVIIDIPKGKKGWRAKPAKSISEAGRIKVLKAPWLTVFTRELERFDPDKDNQQDDQIDCLSGIVKFLIFGNTQRVSSSSGPR